MKSNRQETLKYLKAVAGGWDLNAPHLLYLSAEQSQAYLDVMAQADYSKGFHSETVELISNHASKILKSLTVSQIDLVDLGPGYPDKALPLARRAQELALELSYWPVDVSQVFLDIASQEMRGFVKSVHKMRVPFEKLPASLKDQTIGPDRLVMLGLTFMNFDATYIFELLKEIAGSSGKVLIATEIITGENAIPSIIDTYKLPEVQAVALGPLKVLGFSAQSVEYNVDYKNGRIEMSFRILENIPEDLQTLWMKIGQSILTAVSYRYLKEDFEKRLRKHFSRVETFYSPSGKTAVGLCAI